MAKKLRTELSDEVSSKMLGDSPDQAIQEFLELKEIAAWRRIVKVLDKKIQDYESEILDTDLQGEELNRERDRRDLCLYFRNLPDILSEFMKKAPIATISDNDPYDDPRKGS